MESWEKGGQEVTTKSVSWGAPGDFIKGTYTGKTFVASKGQHIYEIKGELGSFHEVDGKKLPIEPAVKVTAGAFYQVWGKPTGKEGDIDKLFKKSKFGDVVSIKFSEEKESKTKGNAPFKIFSTMQFGADPNYMGETAEAVQAAFPGAEEVEF